MIYNPAIRKISLLIGDVALLYLSLIIALIIRFGQNFSLSVFGQHFLPFSFLFLFWIPVFFIFDLYQLDSLKSNLSLISKISFSILVGALIGVIFFYLIPSFGVSPKTNLLLFVFISWFLLLIWRRFALRFFSLHFQEKVVIIGLNSESQKLALTLKENPQLGYTLKSLIPLENNPNLSQKIKELNPDTVILAKKSSLDSTINKILYDCIGLRINFIDISDAYEIVFQKLPINSLDYVWFLENLQEGKKQLYDKSSRIIDVVLGLSLLIITFPLWPFIALAIKINSKGPVFYKQKRVGKNRKEFWLIKFRSMRDGAEKNGAVWAEEKDPRITGVGRFLRASHLDEIPQMINIIKGNISLVGPRPERPEFVKELERQIPHYHLRHLIKPGFTGWAQTKFHYGRTIQDSFEKFQYDLYYIKNRSFALDLLVLLKTFQLFFKK